LNGAQLAVRRLITDCNIHSLSLFATSPPHRLIGSSRRGCGREGTSPRLASPSSAAHQYARSVHTSRLSESSSTNNRLISHHHSTLTFHCSYHIHHAFSFVVRRSSSSLTICHMYPIFSFYFSFSHTRKSLILDVRIWIG